MGERSRVWINHTNKPSRQARSTGPTDRPTDRQTDRQTEWATWRRNCTALLRLSQWPADRRTDGQPADGRRALICTCGHWTSDVWLCTRTASSTGTVNSTTGKISHPPLNSCSFHPNWGVDTNYFQVTKVTGNKCVLSRKMCFRPGLHPGLRWIKGAYL